jgi:hypothetical protein
VSPIAEDLIVFLLFAAFVLLQVLRSRRRKKARREAGPPVATGPADMQTQSEAEAEGEWESVTPVPPAWTPAPVEGPRPKPPPRALQVHERPRARRFTRRTLLGDRRSLQDAIVVATILGPCRARRPRDIA